MAFTYFPYVHQDQQQTSMSGGPVGEQMLKDEDPLSRMRVVILQCEKYHRHSSSTVSQIMNCKPNKFCQKTRCIWWRQLTILSTILFTYASAHATQTLWAPGRSREGFDSCHATRVPSQEASCRISILFPLLPLLEMVAHVRKTEGPRLL